MKTKALVIPLAILLIAACMSVTQAAGLDEGSALISSAGPLGDRNLLIEGKRQVDCTQIPPESIPPLAQSPYKPLTLTVRVLAEKPDLGLARDYFETSTKGAYGRIGIELVPRYQAVVVPKDWTSATVNREMILDFMRSLFGGTRPKGTDLVYFFTRYWAGGFADCIGGIRDRAYGFALGSIDYALEDIVPMPMVDEGDIAAHELGHLLGAHHHYANCVEAAAALPSAGGACTTMFPLAAGISDVFGTLETTFIRAYAEAYG